MGREQGIVTTRKPMPQPQLTPSVSRIFAVNQQMNQLAGGPFKPSVGLSGVMSEA